MSSRNDAPLFIATANDVGVTTTTSITPSEFTSHGSTTNTLSLNPTAVVALAITDNPPPEPPVAMNAENTLPAPSAATTSTTLSPFKSHTNTNVGTIVSDDSAAMPASTKYSLPLFTLNVNTPDDSADTTSDTPSPLKSANIAAAMDDIAYAADSRDASWLHTPSTPVVDPVINTLSLLANDSFVPLGSAVLPTNAVRAHNTVVACVSMHNCAVALLVPTAQ